MKYNFRLLLPVLINLAGLVVIFCLLTRGNPSAQAASQALQSSIVVTTLEDELNNDGDCSLREAVEAANTNAAVDACPAGQVLTDTITFAVAGTITVTSQLSVIAGGPLVIDGGEIITTSGGGTTRVWYVDNSSELTLQRLMVKRGNTGMDGGAGLYNTGYLAIIRCIFSDNLTYVSGGGIANFGTLDITDSTFYNNWSNTILTSPSGGGIENGASGILTIANSAFIGNGANYPGCLKYCFYGSKGGGIHNLGVLRIENSTFSDNAALSVTVGFGGGIDNDGAMWINNSTFSENQASNGGGISSIGNVVTNTIIANSISGANCYGDITDGGHNLSSDASCGFSPANNSLLNTDPLLGRLKDTGGPTWTQALLPDSPAIDTGDNAHCVTIDQRGFYRPIDGDGDGAAVCDMGSYEYGSVGPRGIHLLPAYPHGEGVPGDTVSYHIDLYNLTGITDTYHLALGSHNWETVIFSGSLGLLPPAGSQAFTVTVTIPLETAWYQTDSVAITATSETHPTVYTTTIWVATQAQPPYSLYLPNLLK
jgi:CSLREA domain-containing protein